jgi:hypothetical protein
VKDNCSKCGTRADCDITQPSEYGRHDYELYCRKCDHFETVGYYSRDNELVLFVPELRRIWKAVAA